MSRALRVAYVCTDPGIPVFGSKGASIHAQAVLTELVAAGHEVHLITPRTGGLPRSAALGAVTVHPLPEIGRGPAAERERSARASDAAVAAILDDLAPDLVYERYALWGRTAMTWSERAGIPAVLEVNAPLVDEQRRFRELVDVSGAEEVARVAFGAAAVVVCVSEPVAEWAASVAGRHSHVHTVPNGVDPERIRPASSPVTPADASTFTVGFVGTLKAWHGVETLVDALARLADVGAYGARAAAGGPDGGWRLLVVGDGPQRPLLETLAEELGVADRVEFTGALAPEAISAQLQRMDVACAPYGAGGDSYFSPLKVYEYLAAGLPVVASAVGQIPAALDGGTLGRLVEPGDPAALAAALADMRADHRLRTVLRERTRETAVQRHSWHGVVQRILALAGCTALDERAVTEGVSR